jgi:cytoskeletal protein RodZ
MKNLALLLPWLLATSAWAHPQHDVRGVRSHHARALEIKPHKSANETTSTTGPVAHTSAYANTTSTVHPSSTPAPEHGTPASKVSGNGASTTSSTSTHGTSSASGKVPTASPSGAKLADSSQPYHNSHFEYCLTLTLFCRAYFRRWWLE